MKKVVAGGFLSIVGSILIFAVFVVAGCNLVTGWDTNIGRLMTTIIEMKLLLPFLLSSVFVIAGIILMLFGCFQKDK